MTRMDADLFRCFRKEKRMSRRDLARVLDVHLNTIHNIESGRIRPSRETEEKFSALTARHARQGEEHAR